MWLCHLRCLQPLPLETKSIYRRHSSDDGCGQITSFVAQQVAGGGLWRDNLPETVVPAAGVPARVEKLPKPVAGHQMLSAQRSDPLTARPLSCWVPGEKQVDIYFYVFYHLPVFLHPMQKS